MQRTAKRLLAELIDSLVLIAIYMAIGLFFQKTTLIVVAEKLPLLGLWWLGGALLIALLYSALFECSQWQGTIGKHLMGLRVTSRTGLPISFSRACLRYLFKSLFKWLFGLGQLTLLFSRRERALHDILSSTLIVENNSP